LADGRREVFASPQRRHKLSQFDEGPPIAMNAVVADAPRARVLVAVPSREDDPSRARLWEFDARARQFR
jgi:hypothetical protein